MEENSSTEVKTRKPLSTESLQKLALAREKANQKRKEMSEQRKAEKELMVQQKIVQAKTKTDEKLEKQATREAKKRMYSRSDETPTESASESQPPETPKVEPASESQPPEPSKEDTTIKKRKRKVVVEYSSSDSDDMDMTHAKVLFVKKERTKKPNYPKPVASNQVPDPLLLAYRQMFGN